MDWSFTPLPAKAAFAAAIFVAFGAARRSATSREAAREPSPAPGQVVFVCEHGSVKSLIAAEWFNRLAAERGLAVRAASRGLAPDPAVPASIAEKLRGDGFEVAAFRPRALAPSDLDGAARLVMIGAPLPAWASGAAVATERWDGIPPASQGYAASRDALRERIATLLHALAGKATAR
jgi:protein-tyrosine-phosphatase